MSDEQRVEEVVASGIFECGMPNNEAEAMALARWAYLQGYIDGHAERSDADPKAAA